MGLLLPLVHHFLEILFSTPDEPVDHAQVGFVGVALEFKTNAGAEGGRRDVEELEGDNVGALQGVEQKDGNWLVHGVPSRFKVSAFRVLML